MNKAELVEEVSGEVGLSKRETQKVINAIIGTIGDTLAAGEKVTLVGFGTFGVRQRKARTGRNPQTGATLQIPAKKVPKFLAGKALREAVSSKETILVGYREDKKEVMTNLNVHGEVARVSWFVAGALAVLGVVSQLGNVIIGPNPTSWLVYPG